MLTGPEDNLRLDIGGYYILERRFPGSESLGAGSRG